MRQSSRFGGELRIELADRAVRLADLGAELFESGGNVNEIGLRTRQFAAQPLHVVGGLHLSELCGLVSLTNRAQGLVGSAQGLSGGGNFGLRIGRGGIRLFDRTTRHERAARRHAPAVARESVTLTRHHDQLRVGDRHVNGALPVLGDHGAAKEGVEDGSEV